MSLVILKGEKRLFPVEQGVGEFFYERAKFFGKATFQIQAETGRKQSFSNALERSTNVALGLKSLGVQRKDEILICCPNNLDNIIPFLSSLYLDALVCSIDPCMDKIDIDLVVATLRPKVIFVEESVLETIEDSLGRAQCHSIVIVIGNSITGGYKTMHDLEMAHYHNKSEFKPQKVNVHETGFLFLSSGTTSTPKLIGVSHYRFLHSYAHISPTEPTGNERPFLQRASLFWTVGVRYAVVAIASGIPNLVTLCLDPLKTLEMISRYKVGSLSIGAAYDLLNAYECNSHIKFDFSNLLKVTIAGNKVPKETILKLRKIFHNAKIFNVYGSTEAGVICTFPQNTSDAKAYEKVESVGLPDLNVEIMIVDIESRKPLGPYESGEILVKSPFVSSGYYNSDKSLPFEKENFLKTGDIGYYDTENYVYITDRLNETFKIRLDGGPYMISPTLIEETLLRHVNVKEAVVFGVPDRSFINKICALVVLKDNVILEENLENNISSFVKNQVPKSHEITGGIKFINELSKTTTGKFRKRHCREVFLAM